LCSSFSAGESSSTLSLQYVRPSNETFDAEYPFDVATRMSPSGSITAPERPQIAESVCGQLVGTIR
jgi:hypothetical protein